MGWVFGIVAVTLGILLVWGLISPRSQWRVLRSWAVSDPHRNEPGGAAYGFLRLGSAVGVLGLAIVGAFGASSMFVANLPPDTPRISPVVAMWGSPPPLLLNRVFVSVAAPPEGLVEMPVLGYQTFDEGIDAYLLGLRHYALLGNSHPSGLLGSDPEEGRSAIGSSNLLVNVRGPLLCIPREVLVVETEDTVQVAVYYGLPDPKDGSPVDHVAGCSPEDPLTGSLLIPVQLSGPVLDRTVVGLAGEELRFVRTVE